MKKNAKKLQLLKRYKELYDAGKTREDVMAEMKISQATYYRYRQEIAVLGKELD